MGGAEVTRLLAALFVLLMVATPASANLSQNDLKKAVAEPPRDAQLPAGLSFTDQRGERTTIGDIAQGKPTVFMFVDYTCSHICGPGMTLTAGALSDSGLKAGKDYALVIVGIDPKDDIHDAQTMAAERLRALPQVARNAHLLTGSKATIDKATHDLGYGYVYDPSNDQFAHDASIYIFAPDGHLATLLPEMGVVPVTIKAAITNAGSTTPKPGVVKQIASLCYGFASASGVYGRPIVVALKVMGVLILVAIGILVWRVRKRRAA